MNMRWISSVLVLGAFAAVASESVPRAVEDAVITARIETIFLLNEHLSPFTINTTTVNGVVTLSGGVATTVQRDLAEDLAQSVDGVKEVVNKITVVPAVRSSAPKRNWKQKVEDKTVSASVRAQLLYYRDLTGLEIGVRTENNIVTLSGVVHSEEHKERIGRIANETRGVDKVINNLTVAAKEGIKNINDLGRDLTDEFIEKRVETAIALNRYVSIRKLDVEMNDGVCILTGTADTPSQKELAGSIAENIQSVRQVRNDIHVRTDETPESAHEQGTGETKPPVEIEPLELDETGFPKPGAVQEETLPSPVTKP